MCVRLDCPIDLFLLLREGQDPRRLSEHLFSPLVLTNSNVERGTSNNLIDH